MADDVFPDSAITPSATEEDVANEGRTILVEQLDIIALLKIFQLLTSMHVCWSNVLERFSQGRRPLHDPCTFLTQATVASKTNLPASGP